MLSSYHREWCRVARIRSRQLVGMSAGRSVVVMLPQSVSTSLTVRSTTTRSKSPHGFVDIRKEIIDTFDDIGTKTRVNSSDYLEVKECHLCDKGKKSAPDNIWKLNVRPNGSYYCFRCSMGGDYADMKSKLQSHCGEKALTFASDEVERPRPFKSTKSSQKTTSFSPSTSSTEKKAAKYLLPMQKSTHRYHCNLFPQEGPGSTTDTTTLIEQRRVVKAYLNDVRGLTDDILRRYQVGFTVQQFMNEEEEWEDHVCVTFPWMLFVDQVNGNAFYSPPALRAVSKNDSVVGDFLEDPLSTAISREGMTQSVSVAEDSNATATDTGAETQVKNESEDALMYHVRTKYRSLKTKGLQRILPKGGAWGFFGWNTVRYRRELNTLNAIVLTEGEYDAMAVAQGLKRLPDSDPLKFVPAISLPNGCNSLPNELVSLLDPFKTIYLWMDNDKNGQDACEKFTRKLGLSRCIIIKPLPDNLNPPKDANDALRVENDSMLIPNMLRQGTTVTHKHIEAFGSLRSSIMQRIVSGAVIEGSTTPSLPGLTSICKGFRRGELVIVSGPTGSGKTTLLSQLSIDFANAGKPVLWGSFELKNHQLTSKMVHQFAKLSVPLNMAPRDHVNKLLDDFEALPLQFMNYHGETKLDDLFETMEHAVDKDDIQHIFIDNLQFLLPRVTGNKSGFERIDLEEKVLDMFRRFATAKNVNIFLVVHPKKEDEFADLGLSSIGNSMKSSQEADSVLILQRATMSNVVPLDVKKNRFDGFLGRLILQFNAVNQTLTQTSDVIVDSKQNRHTTGLASRLSLSPKELWERNRVQALTSSPAAAVAGTPVGTDNAVSPTPSAAVAAPQTVPIPTTSTTTAADVVTPSSTLSTNIIDELKVKTKSKAKKPAKK